MDERLGITALTAGYPGYSVLAGVSLDASGGEVLGLIGPNGAGKSTLLKAISRSVPSSSGVIRVDGRPLDSWAPRELARHLAVMSTQELPQAANLSVRDYVGLGRAPYQDWFGNRSAADALATQTAIEQVALAGLAERPFMAISAGERQRAQLARALAQCPTLLLLDEPTSHLDIGHQQTLLRVLRRVASQGVTIVIAIHDLNLAAATCDRLILLDHGQVQVQGPPADVLTREWLTSAYGHPWLIHRHPVTGRPFVFPADPVPMAADAPLIHLIGGGGALSGLVGPLQAWGYRLQTGVLHCGDSDVQIAHDLGIPCLEAPSFAPIDATWQAALRQSVAEADVLIVADVPFGPGNVGNLAALQGLTDLPMVGVADRPWAERDFTGGQVTGLVDTLPITMRPTVADLLAGFAPESANPGTWPIPKRRP